MSEQDPKVIIRYPNLSGAIVRILQRTDTEGYDHIRYDAECTACLDKDSNCVLLSAARKWAAEHSATCRALPQPEHIDQ